MGLRINTNVQSMQAQRSLSVVNREQSNVYAQLSSGQRINKAGDDAAGLAISEKLKADIRGSAQAARNAGDGISIIQTAEGGLNEVSNILVRLRELSVQAASDTVGDKERAFSDMEYQQLTQELQRISETTEFNGIKLLSGKGTQMDFQVGVNNDPFQDRISFNPSESDASIAKLGLQSSNVQSKGAAQANLEKIDGAMHTVSSNRANLGALQNRLQSTISNLEVKQENMAEANSRIRDTDVAMASAELARTNIVSSAATSVLASANASPATALRLIS
jgi:flagellin